MCLNVTNHKKLLTRKCVTQKMQGVKKHSAKRLSQFGLLSVLCLVVACANALGLGEIKVTSNLGERLKAQVELLDLNGEDLQDIKIRLATMQDYKKNDLFYPSGLKFYFKVVNDAGVNPLLRITSDVPVEDPFLNLLVEVTSASNAGKVYKGFTLLLDPAPQFDKAPVAVVAPQLPPVAAVKKTDTSFPIASQVKKNIVPTLAADVNPPVSQATPSVKKRRHRALSSTLSSTSVRKSHSASSGQLSLTLSSVLSFPKNEGGAGGGAGLSISKSDPNNKAAKGWSLMMGDSLQEDIIAKEKSINEMKSQIGEMEALVKSLKTKLGQGGASGVAAPVLLAHSQVEGGGVVGAVSGAASAVVVASAVQAIPVVQPQQPKVVVQSSGMGSINWSALLEMYWKKLAAMFALLLIGAAAIFAYRRRQEVNAWNHGIFDDLNHDASTSDAVKPVSALDRSMKVPAYKETKVVSEESAEYDLLEAADIYLRFDNDELAEESLRDAIKINPNNPQSYLTLLGIYDSRGDAKSFNETAQALKQLGDAEAWKKALEMGKKFEIV